MKTLKENFGRRIAVIGAAIATLLVALVLVAAFTVQAKAEPDGRIKADDPYNANQNSITALVHASADDDFAATFSYTITKVSLGGSTAAADLAKMPQLGIPDLNLSVTDGVPSSSTTGATFADRNNLNRREGPGSATSTAPGFDQELAENGEVEGQSYWNWATSAEKCYFVQYPFSSVVGAQGVTWTTPGEYKYHIVESGIVTSNNIEQSAAVYDLRIFVTDTGTAPTINLAVTGYILSQSAHDDGKVLHIDKKDPRRGFGNSNHLEAVVNPVAGEATHYFYGFTFSHAVTSAPQSFYVQKVVDNDSPDLTIDFPMILDFYHTGWTSTSGVSIIGVICDVDYAQLNVDAPSTGLTPIQLVNFTWNDTVGAYRGTFNLKHSQRIVFDGSTAFGGTASTLIPSLTAYTCHEDLETTRTPAVDYSLYTAKAKAYTQGGAAGGEVQYYKGEDGQQTEVDTKGPAKNMFVTYFNDVISWKPNTQAYVSYSETPNNANKVIITNIYNYTPSNFWIDMLPYVVMIGIPIAAFIIWMLARRKKLNR